MGQGGMSSRCLCGAGQGEMATTGTGKAVLAGCETARQGALLNTQVKGADAQVASAGVTGPTHTPPAMPASGQLGSCPRHC